VFVCGVRVFKTVVKVHSLTSACYDLKYAYLEINKLKWVINPKQTFTEK